MVFVVPIVCFAFFYAGLWKNAKDRPVWEANYSIFLLFFAGIFGSILIVGAGVAFFHPEIGLSLALTGLVGTVIFELPYLRPAIRLVAAAKMAGYSSKDLRKLGPISEWVRCTLWGVGKTIKFLLYCTVLGIFIVKMVEGNVRAVEYVDEQWRLRNKKEWVAELERQNMMQREADELNAKIKR